MSNDENKEEAPETPNSQEPTTVPSEAPAVEEDDQVGILPYQIDLTLSIRRN